MENKYKSWIEGFGRVVDKQLGIEIKKKVLDQCENCQNISNDKKMVQCTKEVMLKFDQTVPDNIKRENVMRSLGNACFNNFFVKIAEKVKKKSKGIEEIIQNINYASGAEQFKLEKNNNINATFNHCLCPIGVSETEEPILKTYCNCSLGWMKSLFNILIDSSVKVELLESITSGGKSCHFIIKLS
ncbi:MAG: DUF6144 family protein [Promethearchaeota archaeon]